MNDYRTLFVYNEWAWQRIFSSLEALSQVDYYAERPFFWGSLHGLAVHGYSAEWIWYHRCQGNAPGASPSEDDYATLADLRADWDPLREAWREYVSALAANDLERVVFYRNSKGASLSVPLKDILRHVVNHGTEHRSQMTPVLHQLGHPTSPLDYIYFILESTADR